ncbi:hypothetical protein OAS39_11715 [Pirellulales bacterium]|nr:hypothetical protein [Pirellulales bacterium]
MHGVRNARTYNTATIALLAILVAVGDAHGDAVIVTRAMQASTIAEIFVEERQVRVEIEVGATDLAAFANILPDELYEKVTGRTRPFAERLEMFIGKDRTVQADGVPLRCRIERIVPGKRVVRDDVTGEALVDQPDDAESVIRLLLQYDLGNYPQSLTIRPPLVSDDTTASIGFVCYHNGIPVNDFRYLPTEATLDLDWDDPWYSRFRHSNLRRQFDAPLSAFLYIEPYEVRKEIIVRPRDLQTWVDLGLSDGVITVDQQEQLKKRVAEFLSNKNRVTIDGRVAAGKLDRIHFIHRTLRTTGIIEPPVDLDAASATLGVIFVYPIEELPEEVSMKWELFNPKIEAIPAVASDETGGLPAEVTPEDPVLIWKNYLTNPTNPEMLLVALPPSTRQLAIPLVSAICVGVVFVSLAATGRRWSMGNGLSRIGLASAIVAVVVGLISLPFAKLSIADPFEKPTALPEQEVERILSSLLHNVYRSFDHHDEKVIYDRLAKCISGELLSDVYLETRKSMEIKNQGGLRISVKDVIVTEIDSVDDDVEEPTYRCCWRVSGWIGHWGHVHRRENEHVANVAITSRDGAWKISAMELIDEQTIEQSQESDSQQDTAK